MKTRRRNNQKISRRGIAAVEFAVCLPMIMMLLMGTIEACSMIYLKQTLSVSAYEGIRAAILPDATTSSVMDRANAVLTARGVRDGSVTISPANFQTQPPETWITVSVTAAGGSNAVITGWYFDTQTISASATMMKEF